MTMTLPVNDVANRELSIEELEAIAAGNWLGDLWHGVEHVASAVEHWATSEKGLMTIAIVAGAILGGSGVVYKAK
jgi:hypothetical protein